MPSLPRLSGRAVVKMFGRDGWTLVRQKGSHMIPGFRLQTRDRVRVHVALPVRAGTTSILQILTTCLHLLWRSNLG